MKLDLHQIPHIKARWKNTSSGLDYLLARIRRELEERWALAHAKANDSADHDTEQSQKPDEEHPQRKVLLVDFDDTNFQLTRTTIQRISILDSPATQTYCDENDAGSFDGVILCLQPAWLQLEQVLNEALRALRPGGTLLFCTFGPDTLQQLQEAWQQVDPYPHVHPFIDMHLVGDQILKYGFTMPIMDVDRITVEYAEPTMLYADLRAAGFTNLMQSRRKTLTGKSRMDGFHTALTKLQQTKLQQTKQPLAITYELIYGVATAPQATASQTTAPSQLRVAPPKI